MKKINVKVNGVDVRVPEGCNILEAAHQAGIKIPTLCYFKEINEIGACRICLVEVKDARNLVAACVQPVTEGMEIVTNSSKLIESRRRTMELILSTHDKKCVSCVRSGNCELQQMSQELGIVDENYFAGEVIEQSLDTSSVHMIRDNNKCILCRRCSAVCEKEQGVGVIGPNYRGFNTVLGSAFDKGLGSTSCVSCGQCIMVCPVGALYEKDFTDDVLAAIADPSKHVVVQTAPAIRTALGEEFGYPIGTEVEGKMVTALRRMGFDGVFDTSFGADITIMEESAEFMKRLKGEGDLPLMTSCCPSWIKFCEHYFPDLIKNLSTGKSPTQMFGAVVKTYYAHEKGIDPKDIVSVNVMPCTAKKFERARNHQAAVEQLSDVDISITTRELARLIRRVGIDFRRLPDEKFDDLIGESAAGIIFGATGGVMEAALRTLGDKLAEGELKEGELKEGELKEGEQTNIGNCTLAKESSRTNSGQLDFTEIRGTKGIKEATYHVGGKEVKVAIVSGLVNARKVMEKVRGGEADYHFIEVMGCRGGCVNGGGQPHYTAETWNNVDIKDLRAKVLYKIDEAKDYRKSHKNPSIVKLYGEYLGEPGGEKAHKILHTSYVEREVN